MDDQRGYYDSTVGLPRPPQREIKMMPASDSKMKRGGLLRDMQPFTEVVITAAIVEHLDNGQVLLAIEGIGASGTWSAPGGIHAEISADPALPTPVQARAIAAAAKRKGE